LAFTVLLAPSFAVFLLPPKADPVCRNIEAKYQRVLQAEAAEAEEVYPDPASDNDND
jgi:hypothetical protein